MTETFSESESLRSKNSAPWYFHPIFFGIYPVIALLAANIDQIRPQAAIRSVLISLGLTAVVYFVMGKLLRNRLTAAIFSSFVLFMFFAYGHVYQLLEGWSIGGFEIGRHRYIGSIWVVILFSAGIVILKKSKTSRSINEILNIVSIALIIFPIIQIGVFETNAASVRTKPVIGKAESLIKDSNTDISPELLPDVYYIILDGYSREDVLKDLYGYDNSAFINELKSLGFVIPDCAQSNYSRTALSLSSTFYMDYVQNFSHLIKQGDQSLDMPVYHEYIQHNPVRSTLAQYGYQTVAFETGYFWNEITDADIYIVANDNPLEKLNQGKTVSAFEVLFLRTTALRMVDELGAKFTQNLTRNIRTPEEKHHDQVVFALEQLESVPLLPGKKFVYAHIIAPHAPFVFSPDGRYISNGSIDPGYLDATTFINSRVIAIVKSILEKSEIPPVIIIQSDHGWDEDHRMKILNAYYLPNGGVDQIYPTITPVNTFRLVFNKFFGGNYSLLEDTSFYSEENTPYLFNVVPHTCVSTNSAGKSE
jgi:hypothetical protein